MIEMRVYRIPKFDAERAFNQRLLEIQKEYELIDVVPLDDRHYGFLVRPLTGE